MGRKKINIREIENSRQKTVTFARRRAGLIKKAHELSILCGVKVAILMFDSKHASHVYSSADAPEELFARYLNKQFLTNESRKRKDHQRPQHDSPENTSSSSNNNGGEGTYGFDDSGSFVRRRLAVVNQYRVTSDGPSSENLQVKYTKQYHNPGASREEPQRHPRHLVPPDRTSTAGPSSSPSSAMGPPHLQMLQDPRMLGAMGPVYGCDMPLNAPDLHHPQSHQGLVLPARSISLMRRGGGSGQQTPSIAMSSDTGSSPEASFAHLFHTHHPGGAGGPGFIDSQLHGAHASSIVDSNIVLAARDLSSLSLLPDKHMHPGPGSARLPVSSSASSSSSSYTTAATGAACAGEYSHDSQCTVVVGDKRSAGHDAPLAKRPRSQVFGAEDQKCLLDRTLVEQFLADADVAQLLQASWRPSGTSGSACQPGTSADKKGGKNAREENEEDDDEDNEDEDEDDDDDDEEDAGDEDDDSDAETDSGDGSETEGDDDDGSEPTGAHPDGAANLKAEVGAVAVSAGGLAIPQTLPAALPGGAVVAPGNGCLQFYSPDARLQVLSQQQQHQEYQSQNQLLHLQQPPFACLPGAPSPFELAGLADSRRNPPSFLFTQGDGEAIHSYRLHPDMAYAINDGVF
ncbi:hypothetical protein LPJ72_003270 [Coemansia sp. Benny D160-2]|nr:hypothetical protein LPJ72_003270 [Coemansia sp. Benny D160-2]